ncbi:hypothetical protein SPBR_05044 [Sporothrix brasiliensis 5110]|uniref:DUF7924 domain-containing protein n=1 Tax=Sporothrix brasiliensis 5110 TaxID=1398154 RepID=A0A0C2IQF9_9PEZI|nr:uncharacterized protein SPBR_05044 [Sporothrix brasiliensis 5110]KIH87297.1 hypothetical protein SPBR_05044 [Sporothrix brasiliensis 5110]
MSASQKPSRNRVTESIDLASNRPTSTTTKTTKSKSTAYDANFDFHLTDHGVLPLYLSQAPDLTDVRDALGVPRPSLSPSRISEDEFKAFQMANARAKNEAEVTTYVMPTILGPYHPDHPSALQTGFNNLEPLTNGTIGPPVPDIYYGADPGELARPIRDTLSHHIMPSTAEDRPWIPNFSVEVKGPNGRPVVATQQVRYYGAIGSRAIHSLQNYKEEQPMYDGEAHTYSATYHDGMLKLYAHHVTAPADNADRPEYHMTKIRGFEMTDTRETFLQGATAFRNTRDLAKRHRDRLIRAANTKAFQSGPSVPQHGETLEGEPAMDNSQWPGGDKELQQSIADADSVAHGDDPSLEFASSATSSVSSAKRPRQPVSPPSQSRRSRSSKSQKRPRKRRTAESPPTIAAPWEASEAWEDT